MRSPLQRFYFYFVFVPYDTPLSGMLSGGFLFHPEHLEELHATSKQFCLPPQPLPLMNIKVVYN